MRERVSVTPSCPISKPVMQYFTVSVSIHNTGVYKNHPVCLSKCFISATHLKQRYQYWWNFTHFQFTTWGCALRRIVPVENIPREIISSMCQVFVWFVSHFNCSRCLSICLSQIMSAPLLEPLKGFCNNVPQFYHIENIVQSACYKQFKKT